MLPFKILPLLIFFLNLIPLSDCNAQKKAPAGWVEKVKLYPSNALINAKLDTGADYSSIDASEIHEFEKNGKSWVKFNITDRFGKVTPIEKEIRRYTRIKNHSGSQKRPVIRLGICVGKTYMESDVNIVDRTIFEYQILIGRSFLAGNLVVDSAQTYTQEPECSGVHNP